MSRLATEVFTIIEMAAEMEKKRKKCERDMKDLMEMRDKKGRSETIDGLLGSYIDEMRNLEGQMIICYSEIDGKRQKLTEAMSRADKLADMGSRFQSIMICV